MSVCFGSRGTVWQGWSLVLALALLVVTPLEAQRKPSDAAVLTKENQWNDAFKRLDRAAMKKLLADDFGITEEDGVLYDKKAYIALISDPTLTVEVSEFKDLKARVHGATAIVTGYYHAKGTQKGTGFELEDRFTDVWMKTGKGGWKLAASHYSLLPKSAQANVLH
jgi:ketosteroid isomerase-like protein